MQPSGIFLLNLFKLILIFHLGIHRGAFLAQDVLEVVFDLFIDTMHTYDSLSDLWPIQNTFTIGSEGTTRL